MPAADGGVPAPREEVSLDDALRSVGECGAGQAYIFGLVNSQRPRVRAVFPTVLPVE